MSTKWNFTATVLHKAATMKLQLASGVYIVEDKVKNTEACARDNHHIVSCMVYTLLWKLVFLPSV